MSNLTRLMIGTAVLLVLLLDYTALDDITTGSQPHFHAEYAMLAVSLLFFAALAWALALKRRMQRNPNP